MCKGVAHPRLWHRHAHSHPINSDSLCSDSMEKPSSITSQFLKVQDLAWPLTQLRAWGAFIPTCLLVICHPCSNPHLLKLTTSPTSSSLPSGGCGRKGGCPIEPYLPSPRRTRYRVAFCPQAVLLHCLLALTMQVILQKRPKPKAGAWERQQVGQRASRESTQGNRTSFLFSFPTHTTLKARKEINTQSQRRWPPMDEPMKG